MINSPRDTTVVLKLGIRISFSLRRVRSVEAAGLVMNRFTYCTGHGMTLTTFGNIDWLTNWRSYQAVPVMTIC